MDRASPPSRGHSFTIQDTEPPAAAAANHLTALAGEPIALEAPNSNDSGRLVNCTWAFTDGGHQVVLHGCNPTSTFSLPGTYTITLQKPPLLTAASLFMAPAVGSVTVIPGKLPITSPDSGGARGTMWSSRRRIFDA